MKKIDGSADFPNGSEYAMLTRDGKSIQGFYKYVEESYNDGTKKMRLYHQSSLPSWSPSWYTLDQLTANTDFEIVSINK